MGADTSTLQSINSLSQSLSDIESKLTAMEAVHLHHERTISHDNKVFISGKLIQCRSGITLAVGPVIGLVGPTSVRILLEACGPIGNSVEITFNFYSADELDTRTRFLREEVARHYYLSITISNIVAILISISILIITAS